MWGVPPVIPAGWGDSRPPQILHRLALWPRLLFFLAFLSLGVAGDFQCSVPDPNNTSSSLKHVYVLDRPVSVTLMTSRRVPHLLLTHVVAIFLRRHLGYEDVKIIYDDAYYPRDVWAALGYDVSGPFIYYDESDDFIPRAMANMEIWAPPGYLASGGVPLGTDSYLGLSGRKGWFVPCDVIEAKGLVDHWRTFAHNDSEALKVFHRTEQELEELRKERIDPHTNMFYCSDSRCNKGVFTPKRCVHNICATLFSSYYNVSSFLIDHVNELGLYVKVAWLGPNLNPGFLEKNFLYDLKRRSVLFFHWTPDVLVLPFNLTSIAFPSCEGQGSVEALQKLNNSEFCIYEMHQIHKFIWSGLKKADIYLHESLERITLDADNYNSLMKEYNDEHKLKSFNQIACSWMLKNKATWDLWKSGKDPRPTVYFVGLFPVNATLSLQRKFLAPGNIPAFTMALDDINNNNTILSDHVVSSIVLNSACEQDRVLLEFIRVLQYSTREGKFSKIVGIVGPACSDTVEPLAGVSKYFKMPIISYGAEGAIFSDRLQYPYFYRTIPENKIFRHVYLQLFQKMNWARAASLTEDGHKYSEYLTPLQDLFQDNSISLMMRKYPQERVALNITPYLKDLKEFRIVIGDFYEDVGRHVFCQALRHRMTGWQGFVWFLPRWYSADWFNVDHWNINNTYPVRCSTSEMIHALQGHMSLSYKYFGDDGQITPSGITVKNWRDQYQQKVIHHKMKASDYAGFTYDAVWAYALALNNLFKEDLSFSANLRSHNTTERFMHYLNATDFFGVSGRISFASGPSRVTDIVIWQFQNQSYKNVGCFYPDENDPSGPLGRLDLRIDDLVWPLGVPPKDGSKECFVEGFRALLGELTSCNTAIIALCTISFGSLALLLILLVLFLKRRYEAKLLQMEEMWRDQSIFKKFEGWEINRSKVVINRKLGEGQFGTVYGGECLVDHQGWLAVAVKTLKVGSTIAEKLDFLSEAEMMKNLSHENIVTLLGVCTQSEPIYTVMEFMLYGDLKTYLLARRHLVNEKNRTDDDEVSDRRLTSMALDVAKALSYLAEMKLVHRDVACRNCLVNTHRSVKLADFGMTRPLNEKNYYRFSRKGMLPVRWMAPESLGEGIFTPSSDIWSYGVLLYEVITFGAFPFQGLNNNQVFEKVKSGQTLPIPMGVNQSLECLLHACWHPVASKRLTAAQIMVHLENSPRLITPCLDAPQSSMETPGGALPTAVGLRKLSLSLRTPQGAAGGLVGGGRKRSMSGNMMLSDEGRMSSNIEALNLTHHVTIEEIGGGGSLGGEDPLLPPSQYISSSRFMSSFPHWEKEVKRGGEISPRGGGVGDLWTNITPV